MRRGILSICISMLLISLLTVSSFGATEGYTTDSGNSTITYDSVTTKYSARCGTDLVTADNQYVLLVVKKNANGSRVISEETIMYIDQKAASDDGISFDFIPKNLPDCEVLLGGIFKNSVASPVKLGELIGQGVEVSGNIVYQQSSVGATVTLYDGTTVVTSTSTDTNGHYNFISVPVKDDYKIVVTKPGYCSYTLTGVDIMNKKTIQTINIKELAGDIIEDGRINGYDLTEILKMFNKNGANITTVNADIDRDGTVNGYDLQYLLSSFNKISVSEEER